MLDCKKIDTKIQIYQKLIIKNQEIKNKRKIKNEKIHIK